MGGTDEVAGVVRGGSGGGFAAGGDCHRAASIRTGRWTMNDWGKLWWGIVAFLLALLAILLGAIGVLYVS